MTNKRNKQTKRKKTSSKSSSPKTKKQKVTKKKLDEDSETDSGGESYQDNQAPKQNTSSLAHVVALGSDPMNAIGLASSRIKAFQQAEQILLQDRFKRRKTETEESGKLPFFAPAKLKKAILRDKMGIYLMEDGAVWVAKDPNNKVCTIDRGLEMVPNLAKMTDIVLFDKTLYLRTPSGAMHCCMLGKEFPKVLRKWNVLASIEEEPSPPKTVTTSRGRTVRTQYVEDPSHYIIAMNLPSPFQQIKVFVVRNTSAIFINNQDDVITVVLKGRDLLVKRVALGFTEEIVKAEILDYKDQPVFVVLTKTGKLYGWGTKTYLPALCVNLPPGNEEFEDTPQQMSVHISESYREYEFIDIGYMTTPEYLILITKRCEIYYFHKRHQADITSFAEGFFANYSFKLLRPTTDAMVLVNENDDMCLLSVDEVHAWAPVSTINLVYSMLPFTKENYTITDVFFNYGHDTKSLVLFNPRKQKSLAMHGMAEFVRNGTFSDCTVITVARTPKRKSI